MIKLEKYWHNLVSDSVSLSFHISAICLLSSQYSWIFTIISKPSHTIPSIIRNVYTIAEIYTTGLDITAYTNNKTGTPISLCRIGQFPVDRRPEQWELAVTGQVIVND